MKRLGTDTSSTSHSIVSEISWKQSKDQRSSIQYSFGDFNYNSIVNAVNFWEKLARLARAQCNGLTSEPALDVHQRNPPGCVT
ncbi:hypothetical protein J6590_011998 [Homalodisca vitripennis]|nr:hypothetical protein J6590_011998 [Homalodisca vitripennis]